MTWRIDYSETSWEFITEHKLQEKVREEFKRFFAAMNMGKAPSNLRELEGKWAGYYRLRKGKIRIVFHLDKTEKALYVERIDFRGNVYK
jgi:mRNA interferase RelE/StbE